MCARSGAIQDVQVCALVRATWHELQRDLQMAATCPGRGQAANQGQLLLVPGMKLFSKRYIWGIQRPDAACLGFVDL